MGKATVDEIVNEATAALGEGGTPTPSFETRAKNPTMARAKRAVRKCQRELEHRIKYGEPTARSVPELVAQMESSVRQWNEGFAKWWNEQEEE